MNNKLHMEEREWGVFGCYCQVVEEEYFNKKKNNNLFVC
jgi:hypothetical protein